MTARDLREIASLLEEEVYRLRVEADYAANHNDFVKRLQQNASSQRHLFDDLKPEADPDDRLLLALANGAFDVPSHTGMEEPVKTYDDVAYFERWLTLVVGKQTIELCYRAEDSTFNGYSFDKWVNDHDATRDFIRNHPSCAEILREVLDIRSRDHFHQPSLLGEARGQQLLDLARERLVEREAERRAAFARQSQASEPSL